MRLGALAYGTADDEQWGTARRVVDYFDVKADVERLFACASARRLSSAPRIRHCIRGAARGSSIEGRAVGWLGELHPKWQQELELPHAPVLFEVDTQTLCELRMPAPQPVARFPGGHARLWRCGLAQTSPTAPSRRRFAASPRPIPDLRFYVRFGSSTSTGRRRWIQAISPKQALTHC